MSESLPDPHLQSWHHQQTTYLLQMSTEVRFCRIAQCTSRVNDEFVNTGFQKEELNMTAISCCEIALTSFSLISWNVLNPWIQHNRVQIGTFNPIRLVFISSSSPKWGEWAKTFHTNNQKNSQRWIESFESPHIALFCSVLGLLETWSCHHIWPQFDKFIKDYQPSTNTEEVRSDMINLN